MIEALFRLFYPFVALISVYAYIPQIKTLRKAVTAANNVSIRSWLLWLGGSSLSLGYGIFCLADLLFCLVTGLSIVLELIVISLIIQNRYVHFGGCRDFGHAFIEYFFKYPFLDVPAPLKVPVKAQRTVRRRIK